MLSSVTRALGVPPTPANWTLDHYREVLTPRTVEALGRSLGLAVAAASLLVLLGGAGRGARAAPVRPARHGHPGHADARAARLDARGRPADRLRPVAVAARCSLILLAYLAKLWAFAHRPIAGALDRLPPDELRAPPGSAAPAR